MNLLALILLLSAPLRASEASKAAATAPGPDYILSGDFLEPGRPFRAAEFTAAVASLGSLRSSDPGLAGRLEAALRRADPERAGDLIASLSGDRPDPCLAARLAEAAPASFPALVREVELYRERGPGPLCRLRAWWAALAGRGGARPASAPAAPARQARIIYPAEGALFPSDFRSPEFKWDAGGAGGPWRVELSVPGAGRTVTAEAAGNSWTPARAAWEELRALAKGRTAVFRVSGAGAAGAVSFGVSTDPVGAPVFFRAVPSGVLFPQEDEFVKVKWKLAWLSSYDKPLVVMKNKSRCFNCHSVSADGLTFGFDYNTTPSDMSSFLLFRGGAKRVEIRPENLMDWNAGDTGHPDYPYVANASAISPDGGAVVTSAKAFNFLARMCPDARQFTFPMRGIILYRTYENPEVKPLPGGDDLSFLHVPTCWSPDGKYVYFFGGPIPEVFKEHIRGKMEGNYKEEARALGWRELDRLYPFRFDVYRIPFDGGRGGRMERVRGASANGRSNYYPRVSPDGKWLVYTQSANGSMLIREDSDLYIVPAAGGTARRLRGNGPKADSWHSWSPNGRWLVYASKNYRSVTDLMLTHIDENGNDSPPIVLTRLRDEDGLSLNLPEFLNIKPGQFEELAPSLP